MNVRSIPVRRTVLGDIVAHARAEAPHECCGLLLGNADRIEVSCRGRNLLGSRTRFQLDPADHFAALKQARLLDLAVVGIYHSHPAGPPVPSSRDLAEASYPEFLYLIVGLPEGTVEAYCLAGGNFHRVELVPVS